MNSPLAPTSPPTLDPVAAQRWAARPLAHSPWLHEEVARRMQERLSVILMQPQAWADWEPWRGGAQAHRALRERLGAVPVWVVCALAQEAQALQAACAAPWWSPARWRGPRGRVGRPAPGSVQMVWANMLLHQVAQPQALLAQWHQALATDGFVLFSCLGPDTLREIHGLHERMGWPAPAQQHTDMHDWGDMLVQAGFAEPVMDMERLTLTYESPERLLQELRELGRNLHPQRHPALRGRGWQARWLEALRTHGARDRDGRWLLTFEVVYGHALKPLPRAKVQAHSQIDLHDLRQMLRHKGHAERKL